MVKKYKVLILHSHIGDNDGSSLALKYLLKDLYFIDNYKILTLNNNYKNLDLNVKEIKSYEDFEEEVENGQYDLIHNFRLLNNKLILWAIKYNKKHKTKLPIITTVNQRPSFISTLLHPTEIKNSFKIIFIDKTAYKDKMIRWLPDERKKLIYCVTSQSQKLYSPYYHARKISKRDNPTIIFGRGSTINKCPPDMIDIFEKIEIPNKEFRIYGIPLNSWVEQQAKQLKNVNTFPLLPLKEWLEALSKIDIFLYQLPLDAYSSLDGTLGAAMLLGIPVVYYGPDAPKERFEHGINGFVAKSKEEIVQYATILGNDPNLRKKIGDAGRESTLSQYDWHKTVEAYHDIYRTARTDNKISIPITYTVKYYLLKLKNRVKENFKTNYQKIKQLKY